MQKIKQIQEMSFLVALLVLMMTLMSWAAQASAMALAGVAFLFIALVNHEVYLKKRQTMSACHVLNISFLGYALYFCLSTGGFESQGVLLLLFVPVLAMLYEDRKTGFPLVAFTAFGFLLLSQRPSFGPPNLNLEYYRVFYMAGLLLLFSLGMYILMGRH